MLLGETWKQAIPFIEYLSIWAFFSTFSGFSVVAFNAIARTDMTALLSMISIAIRITVLLSSVALWGAIGVAAGMLISQFVLYFHRNGSIVAVLVDWNP